jgi:hypothetical protein
MVLTFRYTRTMRSDGLTKVTPSIPVTLLGEGKIPTNALIDSGADISVIARSAAKTLGLGLDGPKRVARGIGGKVESVNTEVPIAVEQDGERHVLTIPVKVMLGEHNLPMLLGRAGFFDRFVITFDQPKGLVSLAAAPA